MLQFINVFPLQHFPIQQRHLLQFCVGLCNSYISNDSGVMEKTTCVEGLFNVCATLCIFVEILQREIATTTTTTSKKRHTDEKLLHSIDTQDLLKLYDCNTNDMVELCKRWRQVSTVPNFAASQHLLVCLMICVLRF
jgi:hypothetical protein